jgi:23S rRNA G2445 N2-methylase RlmL
MCEIDVLEGLERIARNELVERLGRHVSALAERAGALRFCYTGELGALLALRCATSAYVIHAFDVPRPRALLGHAHLTALTRTIQLVMRQQQAGAFQTLRLSAAGEDSAVLLRLKDELATQLGLAVADEGDLLVRLRRGQPDGWEALVRLSPRPLATRAWRVCNFPGAPNATLAHALAQLTLPAPDDMLLNVCCGSGTLLVERLATGPARRAIGCDIDAGALACAQANLEAAGLREQVRLERWDATALPIDTASINVIIADLPFGQLVGSHRENAQLYPRLLSEAARIAAPNARMVLLTHEMRLLERAQERAPELWELAEVVRVRSGGLTPGVLVFRRRI